MMVVIGNAPSSGSTFLADLFDSLPFGVCGPELRLFSNKRLYSDFRAMKKNLHVSSASALLYQTRQRLLTERVGAYGIENRLLQSLVDESHSLQQFSEALFSTFAGIRGKRCTVFFEKTPQNIHCAADFMNTFRDGHFIHIVRHPLFVYKSLLKRGFSRFIAMHTWLVDVAMARQMEEHPRFHTLRYEDLVQSPFQVATQLLGAMGIGFDGETLRQLYQKNRYRSIVSRKIPSWSVKRYGQCGDANRKAVTCDDREALGEMAASELAPGYSQLFGIAPRTFKELSQDYGYDLKKYLPDRNRLRRPGRPDLTSLLKLLRKYIVDRLHNDVCTRDAFHYLQPVRVFKKDK